MKPLVAPGVEDGEEDEAGSTDGSEYRSENGEDLFTRREVHGEATTMTEPALGSEGERKGDD